ncbi:MAG: prepilin-type N-terminal cleavage/methylation domain-containing protein [Betaproteobacteria bacterium]|nr:prepilin-type N-terminal cleavage/methylation domain-containing protein [Betaproteobacteria bacterium]
MGHRKLESGKPFRKTYVRGSTLLEVLVSVLIFSCGMLAIAAQQAGSVKNSSEVQYRAEVIQLVNAYVGKIKAMAPSFSIDPNGVMSLQSQFEGNLSACTSGITEFEKLECGLTDLLGADMKPTSKVIFTPIFSTSAGTLLQGTAQVDIEVSWQPLGEKDASGNPVVSYYRQSSVIGNN